MPNPVFRSKAFQAPVQRAKQEQHAGYPQGQTQQPYGYAGQSRVGANPYAAPQTNMSPDQLANMYQQPSATAADTGRMTYASVINRSSLVFGLIAIGAIVGWTVASPMQNPILYFGAVVVGLVTGLINAFKREPSPVLISVYAAAEGVFLGGLSQYRHALQVWPSAVLATLSVFVVVLALYRSGKVRYSEMTRIVLIAMVGYLSLAWSTSC